jgi:hypothetical protein
VKDGRARFQASKRILRSFEVRKGGRSGRGRIVRLGPPPFGLPVWYTARPYAVIRFFRGLGSFQHQHSRPSAPIHTRTSFSTLLKQYIKKPVKDEMTPTHLRETEPAANHESTKSEVSNLHRLSSSGKAPTKPVVKRSGFAARQFCLIHSTALFHLCLHAIV